MRFINRWSFGLADYLTKQLDHNHEKRQVYYYGFQIVIGVIFEFVILILATLAAGIFLSTFTTLLYFAFLRIAGGGYHMTSYVRCMIASLVLFMLSGSIVGYTHDYWSLTMQVLLAAAAFLTALPVVLKWAPADTPNKPITKPGQKRVLKIISVVIVVLWAIEETFMILGRQSFFSLAGSFGILMAAFMISPAGYRFFDFIGGKGRKPQKTASEL